MPDEELPTEATSQGDHDTSADDPDLAVSDSTPAADTGAETDGGTEPAVVAPKGPPSPEALAAAKRAIEAIVLVATDPIEDQLLAQLLELPVPKVRELCAGLAASYRAEHRGFQFVEVAGGWRYQTHPEMAPYVERYVLEGQTARLSSAALETLSIVAYKQPVSRAQVSAIRGVNVDGVLRTLVQKGYVEEKGKDVGPGQATLFGTTQLFLERLGLNDISDLPPLGEFVPDADIVEALELTLRVAPEEPELPLDGPVIDLDDDAAGAPVGADVVLTDDALASEPNDVVDDELTNQREADDLHEPASEQESEPET